MSLYQGAVRPTLIYPLAAGLWVFFSDSLLAGLSLSAERAEQVQLLKGLCFVLLSGLLLYLILCAHVRQQVRMRRTRRASEERLPLHKPKLDMSFVRGLPHDSDDVAITRAVVALGHSLDLKVLAEGIERPEQMAFLRQIGCDYGQGYLFGRPQPVEPEPEPSVAAP